jgi:mono/diheme cytochrome c family protein
MDATAATIREGSVLYETFCLVCHGVNVVAGPTRDLRYSSEAVHHAFESIVLHGTMEGLGMPSFGDLLTAEQVRAIQAYVLFRAEESASPSNEPLQPTSGAGGVN